MVVDVEVVVFEEVVVVIVEVVIGAGVVVKLVTVVSEDSKNCSVTSPESNSTASLFLLLLLPENFKIYLLQFQIKKDMYSQFASDNSYLDNTLVQI